MSQSLLVTGSLQNTTSATLVSTVIAVNHCYPYRSSVDSFLISASDDWMGGGGSDEFDGFLNDGSFNAYADHWGVPLGLFCIWFVANLINVETTG